ncbi:hypothetical protein H5410_064668 [Solanum commersonii]|uniref:Uncharacterized protein n=1 Tax=Solanum commersonii TaxID=4109 RepID=A0A9J5VZ21_SOLCO|nr:hypothetical protein H5410_064668 [Solanum commersonii]
MEKELGRPVAVEEMFKVTHVKKSTNPTEEERWIEPRAQETYEYRSTLPFKSQDIPFTQEENKNLWKQSAGEPIRAEREKNERRREKKERKIDEEIATTNEVENKRYSTLKAQLTFLFESGNILPPCLASSDGSDQEGVENDKSNKESEGDEE